ncbi:hypothetical protein NKR23_g179 [Pleurostoma richardsiae]|uniref:Uncharacterized protein n=1 Tax=Pleurostoma richardsiae TaxID=41990 RepID=A0AA38VX98_9PEZI|nr:hypothetical protein NKR23_g179 [Pleurostoma richardsiae]
MPENASEQDNHPVKPEQGDSSTNTSGLKGLFDHLTKGSQPAQISDEDLKKYTGKSKEEIMEWSKNRPGVAGNQAAGKLGMGPSMGIGGYETAHGVGGWGPSADEEPKFPPTAGKEVDMTSVDKE